MARTKNNVGQAWPQRRTARGRVARRVERHGQRALFNLAPNPMGKRLVAFALFTAERTRPAVDLAFQIENLSLKPGAWSAQRACAGVGEAKPARRAAAGAFRAAALRNFCRLSCNRC